MMLRVCLVSIFVMAYVCGEAATAYLKAWDEGEAPERSLSRPYEQAMLQRLQTYLDAEEGQRRFPEAEALPAKRQMRYNQCYFNPISCFKRRK